GLVATLARSSAFRTVFSSSCDNFRLKNDWLKPTLSSFVHPSVFPSALACWREPEPGQSGVVTCITTPWPASFHASTPLECPQGSGQFPRGRLQDAAIVGSS